MHSNANMTLRDAHDLVKQYRNSIKPNVGFLDQLREYELKIRPHLEISTMTNKLKDFYDHRETKKQSLFARYGQPFAHQTFTL
jgi:2-polyprenyl-6-methoxyphenol hydroxylase-like FAD-dependent oxidoreductase